MIWIRVLVLLVFPTLATISLPTPTPAALQVVTCLDFATSSEANAYYAANPDAKASLDPDGDGSACDARFGGQPASRSAGGAARQGGQGQSLAGVGATATDPVRLETGLAIFRLTHDGDSNFAIELYDSRGDYIELLVNEIGRYGGETVVGIEETGDYVLNVEADGNWRAEVTQDVPTAGRDVPATFSGTGADASPFLELETGLWRFTMTHDGSSNFAVWLFDADGNRIDLLANEIGRYQGSQMVPIDSPGVYLLGIEADGAWTVAIE